MTSKEITYRLLRPRRWISGEEIEAQGGSLRRLREMREEYEIKRRQIEGSKACEYRLVGPKTVSSGFYTFA